MTPAMWPLALCAFLAAAITVWKLTDLSVAGARSLRLLDRMDALLERRMIAEALAAARASDTPGGRAMAAGLARRAAGGPSVARSIENVGAIETITLERGLAPLAATAALAPLLGFLGSAVALIDVLEGTAARSTMSALVPAVAGLALALPVFLLHHYFSVRIGRIRARIRESARRAVDAIESIAGPEPR